MREILFRGKPLGRIDEEGFVYGSLGVIDTDLVAIYQCKEFTEDIKCLVDIGTVGQYTGLTDKNGKKIFEGDILKIDGSIYYVKFHNGTFGIVIKHGGYAGSIPKVASYVQDFIEVIGNIHDNPELLKGGVG